MDWVSSFSSSHPIVRASRNALATSYGAILPGLEAERRGAFGLLIDDSVDWRQLQHLIVYDSDTGERSLVTSDPQELHVQSRGFFDEALGLLQAFSPGRLDEILWAMFDLECHQVGFIAPNPYFTHSCVFQAAIAGAAACNSIIEIGQRLLFATCGPYPPFNIRSLCPSARNMIPFGVAYTSILRTIAVPGTRPCFTFVDDPNPMINAIFHDDVPESIAIQRIQSGYGELPVEIALCIADISILSSNAERKSLVEVMEEAEAIEARLIGWQSPLNFDEVGIVIPAFSSVGAEMWRQVFPARSTCTVSHSLIDHSF